MSKTDAFDISVRDYDRWFEGHALEFELELKAIEALYPKSGEGIEIGVGTGRFAGPLGIRIGIEPSAAMAALATRRGIKVIGGSAELLPLKNDCCDHVLMVTTVCFLESLEQAFAELYRVLRPGGCVVIGFIEKFSILGKKYERQRSISKFYKDASFHSVDEIVEKLGNKNFKRFDFSQALLPDDVGAESKPEVKSGYGEGSFVALRAQRP
ncbi:MAG: class I SAM-dependent methyltransferase [Gammaproteobacteria bacterium]|nr:class I SAM-dependent methyltransferase [Gammaproteobacteria bacterium]